MNATKFRIRKNGKYGFIDESGNEAIEPIFDYGNAFKEGLATFLQDGKYGFINTAGDGGVYSNILRFLIKLNFLT